MDYEERYQRAVAALDAAGIAPARAIPWATRFLRYLGLKPKPPLFMSNLSVFIGQGAPFGVIWGLIMTLFVWGPDGVPVQVMLGGTVAAGVLFGLFMTLYMWRIRRKAKLPRWDAL